MHGCRSAVKDGHEASVGDRKTAQDCLTPASVTVRVTQQGLLIAPTVLRTTAEAAMNALTVAKLTTSSR